VVRSGLRDDRRSHVGGAAGNLRRLRKIAHLTATSAISSAWCSVQSLLAREAAKFHVGPSRPAGRLAGEFEIARRGVKIARQLGKLARDQVRVRRLAHAYRHVERLGHQIDAPRCEVELKASPVFTRATVRATSALTHLGPYAGCRVGATSRWPLDPQMLGCGHRLTCPSETLSDAANSLLILSQPRRLGLVNHRWSDVFIELVGKMR
jgi:hypothetical protein